MCIKVGKWNKSILWCTVKKASIICQSTRRFIPKGFKFLSTPPLLLRWHYTPMLTFALLMDFYQSAVRFDLPFLFVILHSLIPGHLYTFPPSVFWSYDPSCYLHLIKPFPLPKSIPLSLTVPRLQFRFPNSQLFYGDRLSACRPTTNLETQSTVFITPGTGWPSYTPRHWVPILVAFYDLPGMQWECSFPLSPHGDFNAAMST